MVQSKINRRLALGLVLLGGGVAAVQGQTGEPTSVQVKAILDTTSTGIVNYVNLFFPIPATIDPSRLLMPGNLAYRGAFKLPVATSGTSTFQYPAGAMTFYPKGDPTGPDDGYPGSLFAAGHMSQMHVAEVDIPKPVISTSKTMSALPTAKILQPFRAIGARPGNGANPMMSLAYLPAQGNQTKDKLYLGQADGYLPTEDHKAFWISDLDFTNQVGPYRVGTDKVHCYNDFIFQIPKAWADKYTPGQYLMNGRHREGDLCGRGPAFSAIAPWADGNPPALDKPLTAKPVLRYPDNAGLMNYSRGGDVFMDGAFLAAGTRSAVVMVGQKGLSDGEYGTYCSFQGFHDLAGYRPYMIFYDPDELGRAAKGELGLDKPQPYAGIDLNEYLMKPNATECDKNNIIAMSYDPATNNIYLLERFKESPVVHVFYLHGGVAVGTRNAAPAPSAKPLVSVARGRSVLQVALPAALRGLGAMEVSLMDAQGRAVAANGVASGGSYERAISGLRAGLYMVRVKAGTKTFFEKVVLTD